MSAGVSVDVIIIVLAIALFVSLKTIGSPTEATAEAANANFLVASVALPMALVLSLSVILPISLWKAFVSS